MEWMAETSEAKWQMGGNRGKEEIGGGETSGVRFM
jgi:hypothetical protein